MATKIKPWMIDSHVEWVKAGKLTLEQVYAKDGRLGKKVEAELKLDADEPAGSAKAIARHLEAMAARCESVDAQSPTEKQVWYLACLLEKTSDWTKWVELGNSSYVLTRSRVSQLIDALKSEG